MKYRALNIIACPECNSNLKATVFTSTITTYKNEFIDSPWCNQYCSYYDKQGEDCRDASIQCDKCFKLEIMEGILRCQCGLWYPVINGVARLLPSELRHSIIEYYPHFFKKFKNKLPSLKSDEKRELANALEVKGKEDTIYRFSYEWNEFKDYNDDNFTIGIGPIKKNLFSNKRILDAGCGAGRHAKEALKRGALEVFAMDLSNSVDAAFENTASDQHIHVIQGDMFNLPFRKKGFDLIYSLWALPHTHNPPLAFQSMVPFLNRDGNIIVYLYNCRRWVSYKTLALMRKVTTKLPNPTVKSLAFIIGLIDFSLLIRPYRLLSKMRSIHTVLQKITPSHIKLYAPRSFKTCYIDWLDRLFYPYVHYYSYREVDGWLSRAKLSEKSILTLKNYGLIIRGTRKN